VPGTTQREEYLATRPGDTILLCSDGLHGRVSEAEIKQIIGEHTGYPQDAVDQLLEKAVEKGERDDITAVLLELPPGRKVVPTDEAVTAPVAVPPSKVKQRPPWLWILLALVSGLTVVAILLIWLKAG